MYLCIKLRIFTGIYPCGDVITSITPLNAVGRLCHLSPSQTPGVTSGQLKAPQHIEQGAGHPSVTPEWIIRKTHALISVYIHIGKSGSMMGEIH